MPQLFKMGGYVVFFWSNEGMPAEPIHVHIAKTPGPAATKVWITHNGGALVANNNSKIPSNDLKTLLRAIEANSERIIRKWKEHFEEVSYYC